MRAWKEVRDGSPQRSTGRSQDSRMRAWKEGAAWQPAALEELERGLGGQPALEEATRFPNAGLAGWQPAALEEAKIPE